MSEEAVELLRRIDDLMEFGEPVPEPDMVGAKDYRDALSSVFADAAAFLAAHDAAQQEPAAVKALVEALETITGAVRDDIWDVGSTGFGPLLRNADAALDAYRAQQEQA